MTAADHLHGYVLTVPPKVIRIRLQEFIGKAVPNTAYEPHVDSDVFTNSTAGDVVVEQWASVLDGTLSDSSLWTKFFGGCCIREDSGIPAIREAGDHLKDTQDFVLEGCDSLGDK